MQYMMGSYSTTVPEPGAIGGPVTPSPAGISTSFSNSLPQTKKQPKIYIIYIYIYNLFIYFFSLGGGWGAYTELV